MVDLCDHVAGVLHPLPEPAAAPSEALDAAVEDVVARREETAAGLRAAWDAGTDEWADTDPVLASLRRLRAEQRAAESAIRRLLAYAREYNRPTPYKLSDLATAAEMSISGVRTAYTDRDTDSVAQALGYPRRTGLAMPGPTGSGPDPQRAATGN